MEGLGALGRKLKNRTSIRWLCQCVLRGLLVSGFAWPFGSAAQDLSKPSVEATRPITDEKLAEEIAEVKRGNWPSVSEILRAGPDRATPILKELFVSVPDSRTQAEIALTLIKMGCYENKYWMLLLTRAKQALASDAPFPMFEENGGAKPFVVSPKFMAWADAHALSFNDAFQVVTYDLPGRLLQLAMTGDPRAVPVLRQGLGSGNYLTQIASAEGLAGLRDKESIPLIVDACRKSPNNAPVIARFGLLAFGDAEAQRSAEPFLTLEELRALHNGESFPVREPFRKSKSVEK